MNQVSFEEIGAVTATFLAKEDVVPGQVVKITDDGQVGACSDNDAFCGLALSSRCRSAGEGFPYPAHLRLGEPGPGHSGR